MRRLTAIVVVLFVIGVVATLIISRSARRSRELSPTEVVEAYERGVECAKLKVLYPRDDTVFPPEGIPPTLRWQAGSGKPDHWVISTQSGEDERRRHFVSEVPEWAPAADDWEAIKRETHEREGRFTILGLKRERPGEILSGAHVSFATSADEVGAPILYREVNLPFKEAVKDPTRIRWRLGTVDSPKQPPVVLGNLPVCGNCHSFSADGGVIGMDVDYANDKGSYAIAQVSHHITLNKENIISWSDYKREDQTQTFGLLSQVSPDGRYVVSTVKDRSVFVAKDDLAYSQLFFPIRGILSIYDRETKTFSSLPGADDPDFVQSNATWSPDGKYIVFARSKAHRLRYARGTKRALLTKEECAEFLKDGRPFKFDLYRIPFNEGKGGTAQPLAGASANGMSNFFARYSPDGKWIVFCQARNYMLLQPDSQLYIIPAEGGEARRMRCNTPSMNSWHSWSPNSRWLVFASKDRGAYTKLFLAHVDTEGRSSPAVLLSQFTSPDRAANIPEFMHGEGKSIRSIREQFVDDISFIRAARAYLDAQDTGGAIRMFRKALKQNPRNVEAHNSLGMLLFRDDATIKMSMHHFSEAMRIDPKHATTFFFVAYVMENRGDLRAAVEFYRKGLEFDPDDFEANSSLGILLSGYRDFTNAEKHLVRAAKKRPGNGSARYNLGTLFLQLGKLDDAEREFLAGIKLQKGRRKDAPRERGGRSSPLMRASRGGHAEGPRINPGGIHGFANMATSLAEKGRFKEAINVAERGLRLAQAAEDESQIEKLRERLELYRQGKARPPYTE